MSVHKTDLIKRNLKKFNKEVDNFNKRLKNAYKKKAINESTYKTLIIDKDKKDFYKQSIFTKNEFKKFVSELRLANENTLKKSSKNYKSIGDNFNELALTDYEKKILSKRLNNEKDLESTFGTDYADVLTDVAIGDKEKYRKAFRRLTSGYLIKDKKTRVFKETLKRLYKERFGKENKKIDRLSKQQITNLSYNPAFNLNLISPDSYGDDEYEQELQKGFDDLINEELELTIDEGWEPIDSWFYLKNHI